LRPGHRSLFRAYGVGVLRVRVLGALGVEVDGRQIDVPHGRSRQLIAYLALHPGLHPRGQVAGHLWPDSDRELARQRLRTTMWELRRALSDVAEPLVDANREDLGLHSAVIVDLAEAHKLLQAGATQAALELLTPGVAVELDQEWADEARREADAWRLRTLETAMREAVDIGAALSYARRRVALDPLSEGAHRDLIRLLAESGDRECWSRSSASVRRRYHGVFSPTSVPRTHRTSPPWPGPGDGFRWQQPRCWAGTLTLLSSRRPFASTGW
jgi:DNA-binding SARP family transcriptional activator